MLSLGLTNYANIVIWFFQLNGLKLPQVKLHSLLFNFLWDYLLTQLLVHVSCSLMTVSSLSLTSNFLQDGYQGATVDVSKAQQCVNANVYKAWRCYFPYQVPPCKILDEIVAWTQAWECELHSLCLVVQILKTLKLT